MPTYVLRNKRTDETWEVLCSYEEMKAKLSDDIVQVLSTPSFITQAGGTLSRTSDGWKDVLKKVKKGSGRRNTIKT